MQPRPIIRYLPVVEYLEAKQLLNSSPVSADVASHRAVLSALDLRVADASEEHGTAVTRTETGLWVPSHRVQTRPLPTSFLAFRITNTPWQTPVNLVPPFQQVLVQSAQPVPGQEYNILYVVVKNGTAQTFTASNGFTVRLNTQAKSVMFPILTGTEQWKPQQWIVFYVLTKQYYPLPQVRGGFELFLGGRRSTLVPGPSGIFLRLTYKPSTFARTLDWIVAFGQGAQLGAGAKLGLPDTAINEIVAASTRRSDFAGHF